MESFNRLGACPACRVETICSTAVKFRMKYSTGEFGAFVKLLFRGLRRIRKFRSVVSGWWEMSNNKDNVFRCYERKDLTGIKEMVKILSDEN